MQRAADDHDLARLRRSQQRIERLLALPADLLRARTPVSGWCALEHLFHVVLANDMSLKNARNLARGSGRLITAMPGPGERDPRAADILARGRLPRGAQAPRFVMPPANPDLALVREIHAETVAAARSAELAAPPESGSGIPHQALGVLSAAEWIRFARMHSAHHLRIAAAVLAAATARA
jgi:hypothetical protein